MTPGMKSPGAERRERLSEGEGSCACLSGMDWARWTEGRLPREIRIRYWSSVARNSIRPVDNFGLINAEQFINSVRAVCPNHTIRGRQMFGGMSVDDIFKIVDEDAVNSFERGCSLSRMRTYLCSGTKVIQAIPESIPDIHGYFACLDGGPRQAQRPLMHSRRRLSIGSDTLSFSGDDAVRQGYYGCLQGPIFEQSGCLRFWSD